MTVSPDGGAGCNSLKDWVVWFHNKHSLDDPLLGMNFTRQEEECAPYRRCWLSPSSLAQTEEASEYRVHYLHHMSELSMVELNKCMISNIFSFSDESTRLPSPKILSNTSFTASQLSAELIPSMGEMVASMLVQEGLSGVLSLALSNREEKASQVTLMEKLEMAQSELEFALERSTKMPITDMTLLRRRKMLKGAFEECTAMLHKHKDEEVKQRTVPISSSFCRKILHAMQPRVWSFSSPKKDLLTRSEVARFEWFAEKADKFVRDIEYGCSLLVHYRFSNPIVTKLLEGKNLVYSWKRGKKYIFLAICAFCTEEHGVIAQLVFQYGDLEAPMNSFGLGSVLRLSESTNIVGITTKCLQSLGPSFKCLADIATGQLAHLYTQVRVSNHDSVVFLDDEFIGLCRPDPVCCTSGVNKSWTSNTKSSELSGRFPEQVTFLCFWCNISVPDYNLRSSTKHVKEKNMKVWPYLELLAIFAPHSQFEDEQVSSLHHMEEAIHTDAITFFSCQPKQTVYELEWFSVHGAAVFTVSKPSVGDGSMTRRESKRKR